MGCLAQPPAEIAAIAGSAPRVDPVVAGAHARLLLGGIPFLRETLGARSHGGKGRRRQTYSDVVQPATVHAAAAHLGHGFAWFLVNNPWAGDIIQRASGWLRPYELTESQLQVIAPGAPHGKLSEFIEPLKDMFAEFEINTPYRVAAFLGNAIVESDHLKTFTEYASGEAYEGAARLGNTQKGDGKKFKGRGVIQITGRENYAKCGPALGVDLIAHPEKLASDTSLAIRSGGWYWTTFKALNAFADLGPAGFAETVKRVNGAITDARTHWPERVAYYRRALRELGGPVPEVVSADRASGPTRLGVTAFHAA